jgi:hypothetical protein
MDNFSLTGKIKKESSKITQNKTATKKENKMIGGGGDKSRRYKTSYLKQKIKTGLENYENNQYGNNEINNRLQNVKNRTESLLNYWGKNIEPNNNKYGWINLDENIGFLVEEFQEFINVVESNNSKNFRDVKKKIIENLNRFVIPHIRILDSKIRDNINQKEKLELIVSSLIKKNSNIPPLTMNQFIPNKDTQSYLFNTNSPKNKRIYAVNSSLKYPKPW